MTPALFIQHQHAVLDGIEQGLQEMALARQPLHDRLQPFGIQPPDAAQHLVQKTRFGSHFVSRVIMAQGWERRE